MEPTKKTFLACTEAILYMQLVNNHTKWMATCEFYEKEEDYGAPIPDQNKGKNHPHYDERMYIAQFTSRNGGQQRFGTVSEDGINCYKVMMQAIKDEKKARKADMIAKEREIQGYLRDKDGITAKAPVKTLKRPDGTRVRADRPPKRARKSKITLDDDEDAEEDDDATVTDDGENGKKDQQEEEEN